MLHFSLLTMKGWDLKMHASTALPAASCSCGGHCKAWGYELAAQPAQQGTKRQQAALNSYHRHCTTARDKRSSNVQIIPPNSSSPSSDILFSKTRQNCLASANYCLLGPVVQWDKRSSSVASQQNAFSLWCLSSMYKISVQNPREVANIPIPTSRCLLSKKEKFCREQELLLHLIAPAQMQQNWNYSSEKHQSNRASE